MYGCMCMCALVYGVKRGLIHLAKHLLTEDTHSTEVVVGSTEDVLGWNYTSDSVSDHLLASPNDYEANRVQSSIMWCTAWLCITVCVP